MQSCFLRCSVVNIKLDRFGGASLKIFLIMLAFSCTSSWLVAQCTVSPSVVMPGDTVTISCQCDKVTGWNSSGGHITPEEPVAEVETAGAAAEPLEVTGQCIRGNKQTPFAVFASLEVPPPPPMVGKVNTITFAESKYPSVVDNTARAVLDDDALRLKADPNATIVIVAHLGPPMANHANKHESDLVAERAVNAKYYLVKSQGIDGSRIQVRTGAGDVASADIYWVPQGADPDAAPELKATALINEQKVRAKVCRTVSTSSGDKDFQCTPD